MPVRINVDLVVTLAGTAIAVAGVVLIAWVLRKRPNSARPPRRFQRAQRNTVGLTLILVGMFIAMKKYIAESGWGQWVESVMLWLLPVIFNTLLACGAASLLWALFADRARGRKRCPKCWYDMEGAAGLVCPECGKDARTPARLLRTRRNGRLATLAMLVLLLGSVQFIMPWINRGGYAPWLPTRVLIAMIPSLDQLHPRMYAELDRRLAGERQNLTTSRLQLRRLTPLSESSRYALSRAAMDVFAGNPRHRARSLLFELLPDYLSPGDAAKAEPLIIAALNDPDSLVRFGALRTLRRVDGFKPGACVPAIAAMVSPSLTRFGLFNEEAVLSEAVAYLNERGAKDPGTVPALTSLLSPGGSRFFEWTGLQDKVLRALAGVGPAARGAGPAITAAAAAAPDTHIDALAQYTLQMIAGPPTSRREVLDRMSSRPDALHRSFAVLELAHDQGGTPDPFVSAALSDDAFEVRICAAAVLLGFESERTAARAILDRDLGEAMDFMRFPRIIDCLCRHKLNLSAFETYLLARLQAASGTRKNQLQQVLGQISSSKSAAPSEEDDR